MSQVENTLFKLHRDILETHSGFFEDMLSMPTNDDTEGTEENPLKLPADLCSVKAFTTICRYLYPQKLAHFPKVSVKDVEDWEAVLEATVALQMKATREHIWVRLNSDARNIKSDAAKLLRLSMEYEEAPRSFITACLRILAYRRKRITLDEVGTLGQKATWLVNHTRERIREVLFATLSNLGRAKVITMDDVARPEHYACKKAIFDKITANFSDKRARRTDDTTDIFQIDSLQGLCDLCVPMLTTYVQHFKSPLNKVVESCVSELLSTADVAELHAITVD